MRILQSVASGLVGAEAFRGGLHTAARGLALHFFIATVAAGVYYTASARLAILVTRPVVSGLVYGIVVYAVMNFVVLPLSAVAKRPFAPGIAAIILVVHMVCVGLPIALVVRHHRGRA